MSSILITGASSGIGLGLVKQYAQDPTFSCVFATARKDDPAALNEVARQHFGKVYVIKMEPTNLQSAKDAAARIEKILSGQGLDVLINNIGAVNFQKSVLEVTEAHLNELFSSNILTAHHTTMAFLPLLEKGTAKKVFNMSSFVGSIEEADGRHPFPVPAYATSKSGLNMLTKWYATEFKSKGFTIIALNPGFVATERQADAAGAIPVEQCAKGISEFVQSSSTKDNGTFRTYDGTTLPW